MQTTQREAQTGAVYIGLAKEGEGDDRENVRRKRKGWGGGGGGGTMMSKVPTVPAKAPARTRQSGQQPRPGRHNLFDLRAAEMFVRGFILQEADCRY